MGLHVLNESTQTSCSLSCCFYEAPITIFNVYRKDNAPCIEARALTTRSAPLRMSSKQRPWGTAVALSERGSTCGN